MHPALARYFFSIPPPPPPMATCPPPLPPGPPTTWRELVHLIAPRYCPICKQEAVDGGEVLGCYPCFVRLPRLPRLVPAPPLLRAVWSAAPYASLVGSLVRSGKRRSDLEGIEWLSDHAARILRGRLPRVDAVTHVPSPYWRQLWRGVEPTYLYAETIATFLGVPILHLLNRDQGGHLLGRSAAARSRASRGAFRSVAPSPARILLVDDVLTTGATLSACAAELLGSGAEKVYGFTLCARALDPDRPPPFAPRPHPLPAPPIEGPNPPEAGWELNDQELAELFAPITAPIAAPIATGEHLPMEVEHPPMETPRSFGDPMGDPKGDPMDDPAGDPMADPFDDPMGEEWADLGRPFRPSGSTEWANTDPFGHRESLDAPTDPPTDRQGGP